LKVFLLPTFSKAGSKNDEGIQVQKAYIMGTLL